MRKVDPVYFDMNRKKIGGKWKPIILMILRNKPERFNKLKQLLTGISANVLTVSLKELEKDNLVVKTEGVYALTEKAKRIVDLMMEIKSIVETL